jgi:DNA mismatch repair ATPase MutS
LEAFGLLLKYLSDTQKTNLKNIIKISLWTEEDKVYLDDITIRNLEIFKSSYE